MPLPVLDFNTLQPTGELLPLSDYFNPTKNVQFGRPAHANRRDGYIPIGQIVELAKIFSRPEYFDELKPSLCTYRGIRGAEPLLDYLYNALPLEYKYLIFYASFRFNRHERDIEIYDVVFYSPNATDTDDFIYSPVVSSCTIRVKRPFNDRTDSYDTIISTGDMIDLTNQVETVAETCHANFSAVSAKLHVDDADNHPGIVRLALRYSRNAAIFYPTGGREHFPVAYDWAKPATIRDHILNDFKLTFKITDNFKRIDYTVRHKQGSRAAINRILPYSSDVLTYLPYTIRGPKEPKALAYGIELEACGDYTVSQLVEAQKDLFFICKQDGSIHGDKTHCYELVTVPATMKAHKRLWAEFFEKIDYGMFDCSKNTGNGMHIHIGRNAFKKSHLNRFTWFLTNPGNEDFILTISERPTKANLLEWARMPNHHGHPSKIYAAQMADVSNSGIRGAVHYKTKTIEVRLFKGIVSYATIIKNIEFTDSVYHYTLETMLSQLSLANYLDWLEKTPKNKYQMLKAFLAEVKTKDLIAAAEVQDYIWKEKRDFIIVEKLNKAPFKITNTHITTLNKKRRKRSFILDKSGKVICVAPSGGLLAKLDKSVQQKQTRGAATFAMTEFNS